MRQTNRGWDSLGRLRSGREQGEGSLVSNLGLWRSKKRVRPDGQAAASLSPEDREARP